MKNFPTERSHKLKMTDEELVNGMARGDQASFEAFIYRYHGPLLRYLERMLQDEEKAEDFVQEVFLRLIRQIQAKKIPERIRPWLYRVASNLCKDYWRSGRYHLESLAHHEMPERDDHCPSVVEIYERQEERLKVLEALNALSERERDLVILRFYQELKIKEIAQVMEMPLGTVKSALHHALIKLKGLLIDEKRMDNEKRPLRFKKEEKAYD